MIKIHWTYQATQDLKHIYHYYSSLNLKTAKGIYNEIKAETKRLKTFPRLGFVESLLIDKKPTARCLIYRKTYKIIYYIDGNNIYITNIWDCRQNPAKLK